MVSDRRSGDDDSGAERAAAAAEQHQGDVKRRTWSNAMDKNRPNLCMFINPTEIQSVCAKATCLMQP
jgi:hypothetical protein